MTAPGSDPDTAVERAQKTRLRRALLGDLAGVGLLLIVLATWLAGHLEAAPALHFAVALLVLVAVHFAAIRSGINLRFRDPSLAVFQFGAGLVPSLYVMFHIDNPQARTAFLAMAIVGMAFGAFQFGFRRMAVLAVVILGSYLLLLAALHQWAPQRLELAAEAVVVPAYALSLGLMAYLGGSTVSLREALHTRNRALKDAMAELHQLATRDYLTRLPNRGALMEHLAKEAARVQRRPPDVHTLCLCMLDIDDFKRFNDSYGHQAGDAVLRQVADALQRTLRLGDFVGRFGGEEFLLILPETGNDGALRAAERVRREIEDIEVPELGPGERVTVSVGLAVNGFGEAIETTLARADTALYQAKAQGRNRSVLATMETPVAPGQLAAAPPAPPSVPD